MSTLATPDQVSTVTGNQVASVSETHIFTPRVINKLTAGYSRAAYFFTGSTPVRAASVRLLAASTPSSRNALVAGPTANP